MIVIGKTDAARQAIIGAACMEPEGYFSPVLLGAIDAYREAVAHELAEKIRSAPFEEHFLQKHQRARAADLIDPEVKP